MEHLSYLIYLREEEDVLVNVDQMSIDSTSHLLINRLLKWVWSVHKPCVHHSRQSKIRTTYPSHRIMTNERMTNLNERFIDDHNVCSMCKTHKHWRWYFDRLDQKLRRNSSSFQNEFDQTFKNRISQLTIFEKRDEAAGKSIDPFVCPWYRSSSSRLESIQLFARQLEPERPVTPVDVGFSVVSLPIDRSVLSGWIGERYDPTWCWTFAKIGSSPVENSANARRCQPIDGGGFSWIGHGGFDPNPWQMVGYRRHARSTSAPFAETKSGIDSSIVRQHHFDCCEYLRAHRGGIRRSARSVHIFSCSEHDASTNVVSRSNQHTVSRSKSRTDVFPSNDRRCRMNVHSLREHLAFEMVEEERLKKGLILEESTIRSPRKRLDKHAVLSQHRPDMRDLVEQAGKTYRYVPSALRYDSKKIFNQVIRFLLSLLLVYYSRIFHISHSPFLILSD